MSRLSDWFEIFRTGKHKDAAGNTREWTEGDLDRIAAYDPQKHESPVVVGHPVSNSPAWGWVSAVKREKDRLYAKIDKLAPQFVEAVADGRYKKRSISLYPDGTLRHIGFLGGMPPAVKGMEDIVFAENDGSVTYEFEEGRKFSQLGGVLRRLREFILEKFGREAADEVVSGWEIETISAPEPDPAEIKNASSFEEGVKEDNMNDEKVAELQAQVSRLNEALASKDEQIKAHEAAMQALEEQKRAAAFSEFCAPLVAAGKLTPAQRDRAAAILPALSASGKLEFAEGETKVEKTPVELFQEILSSLPVQVQFGEVATKERAAAPPSPPANFGESVNVDEDRLTIHQRAVEIQKEKGIPYAKAAREAMKK